MILRPNTVDELKYLHSFLKERGVDLPVEPNLRMFAHGTWSSPRQINAVVAYNGFVGKTCCMHIAGDGSRWLDRQFLYAGFHYPFVICDLVALFAPVPADNEQALKFNRKIGFHDVLTVKDGWATGISMHLLQMYRNECRWLKELNSEKLFPKAA